MKKNYFLTGLSLLSSVIIGFAQEVTLTPLSTYATGAFDESATEIVAYDSASQRLFSTNSFDNTVDVIDISNPNSIVKVDSWQLYGGGPNSVACKNGIVAVAVEATVKQDSGRVVFYNAMGTKLDSVTVGALPDMVCFSPDGLMVITANEGEPSSDYTVDPNGSVSIITLGSSTLPLNITMVNHIDFSSISASSLDSTVRINGNNGLATIAQDIEPEYVAVSDDNTKAYVTLQENNAIAEIDLISKSVISVYGLGFKDHSLPGNGLDVSDKNDTVIIEPHAQLYGMYMPDAVAGFSINGTQYFALANEGDGREYDNFEDEVRIKDLLLDTLVFPNYATLQSNNEMGRLTVSATDGDYDNDGRNEAFYVFGARSFSIVNAATQTMIYDSGDEFEQTILTELPDYFNSTNDDNDSFLNRSDNKGPEPEAIEIATINGSTYAFIGLERIGGIMVYDISNPSNPIYKTYFNNRDFTADATTAAALDLGPEDVHFIPASASPNQKNLIAVSNEVSGTVTLFEVNISGIGIKESTGNQNVVFPNPTSGLLKVNSPSNWKVMDLSGKMLMSEKSTDQINLSQLTSGVYLVQINDSTPVKVVLQ